MTDVLLSRTELEAAFGALAERLSRRGVAGTVFIFGGAAMVLAFDARAATRDVDAVFEPHGAIIDEVRAVAQERGLPRYWLNEQASSYLASTYRDSATPVWQHPNLRVLAVAPRQLLAMKAIASRRYADLDDIRFLAAYLGITDVTGVAEVVEEVFPGEALSERARLVIEDLLGG
jgi:hypothetical protein